MKKSRRKMAFTLTELLVVVVIIGVLAAVVMPKYARMLDTRRTTEAEEIMRAIRTEQERRCSLGKDYATNMTQLADLIPNANSQYYTYALFDDGKGVTATTAAGSSLNYMLKMPSVVDGRICCEGGNCDQLNKDYPSCTGFQYVHAGRCSTNVWQNGEGDDPGVVYQCSGNQPVDERACPEGCGTQVNKYQCDQTTGEWIPGQWEGECTPYSTVREQIQASCGPGMTGMKYQECDVTYDCNNQVMSTTNCTEWDTSGCHAQCQYYGWNLVESGVAFGEHPCRECRELAGNTTLPEMCGSTVCDATHLNTTCSENGRCEYVRCQPGGRDMGNPGAGEDEQICENKGGTPYCTLRVDRVRCECTQ